MTIFGGVISVSGLLASSFNTSIYGMFLSYSLVWGTGSSLCYASTYVVVDQLFHKHLAFAMGFLAAGSGVGGLVMSPSTESMLEAFGWKTTMRILAILALCLIIAAVTYREPIQSQERTSSKRSWRQLFDCSIWCIPAFTMLTISLAIFNFGYYTPIIHVVRIRNPKYFSLDSLANTECNIYEDATINNKFLHISNKKIKTYQPLQTMVCMKVMMLDNFELLSPYRNHHEIEMNQNCKILLYTIKISRF